MEDCRAALGAERLAWLVGRDVADSSGALPRVERRMPRTPAACAAVDIALHDLLAQRGRAARRDARAARTTPSRPPSRSGSSRWARRSRRPRNTSARLPHPQGQDRARPRGRPRAARAAAREASGAGRNPRRRQPGLHGGGDPPLLPRDRASRARVRRAAAAGGGRRGLRALPEEVRERIAADESLLVERTRSLSPRRRAPAGSSTSS